MSVGELAMFGKAYDTVGSTNKNLILQTRGDLKIRWGNKFIDLIKNGKINVNVDLLKQADNKDSINKDGIYLIQNEENQEVWLYIGGTLINLLGEVSDNYVTYLKNQDIDADGKFRALSNIGLYYNTLNDAIEAKLTSGIIYILDQNKFYYINNGEYQEYQFTNTLEIPNPLQLGKLQLNGTSQEITASDSLNFNITNNKYISLKQNNIQFYKNVILDAPIYSNNYEANKSGFALYANDADYIGEFDIIKVRKAIIYEDIEDITYDALVEKINNSQLYPGKKYRIIDFYNEWDNYYYDLSIERSNVSSNYDGLYEDPTNVQFHFPITIAAKTKNSLEKEGYYCDNENWKIEYDINFHYLIEEAAILKDGSRIIVSENISDDDKNKLVTIGIGSYETQYSKGRITKLTDEFGNSANYDFKHRLFKHTSDPNNRKTWFYTFNRTKTSEENVVSLEWKYIHNNWDASLDGDIKNNIFNLPEPELENYTTKSTSEMVQKVKQMEDYVIFTNKPHDNNIKLFKGQYYITNDFYNNTIRGFIQNITSISLISINFKFFNNICNNIYIYGEPTEEALPSTSDKLVTFKENKTYSDNMLNDIINCQFEDDFIYNKFYDEYSNKYFDLTNCSIQGSIQYTTFKGNIKETTLNTVTNTTFNKEIQKLEASNSNIENCIFNGIIEDATIKGKLINCQFEKLSGNIEIGKAEQNIQQMIVQVDLSPNVAGWVQKDGQITQYQECSPLKINIDNVPRLSTNAKKECFIREIQSKKIFYVQLSSDDNTPRGTILMFYPGTLEEEQTLKDVIPDGYAICDGTTEGVPDLRGRFIRSANSYDDVGEHNNNDLVQGESERNNSIKIKEDNLPPHTHTFNVENTLAISEYTGNSVIEGTANTGEGEVNIPVISSSSHTHSLTGNISISQNPDTFANNPINIEPNAYALIFIMKL